MPRLLATHLEVFEPSGPFAGMLFAHLEELSRPATGVDGDAMHALAENVCNLLTITSGTAGMPIPGSRDARRQALVRYLRQHACDPALSVETAAAALKMSRRLVQQLLQEADTSFTQLVTAQRLRSSALRLTGATGIPVSEIAYQCGFTDVSHFNHLFKRRYGVAPSEYRRLGKDALPA